ncbi:hypothetical protein K502DRAFT_361812, partial [Neoconidiobolus thromboides FSU 785]
MLKFYLLLLFLTFISTSVLVNPNNRNGELNINVNPVDLLQNSKPEVLKTSKKQKRGDVQAWSVDEYLERKEAEKPSIEKAVKQVKGFIATLKGLFGKKGNSSDKV